MLPFSNLSVLQKRAIGCNLANYFIPLAKIHTFWQCCGLYCWRWAAVLRCCASRNLNSALFCWCQRAAFTWFPQYRTPIGRLGIFLFCLTEVLYACVTLGPAPGSSQTLWRFGVYLKFTGFYQTESNNLRYASYTISLLCAWVSIIPCANWYALCS